VLVLIYTMQLLCVYLSVSKSALPTSPHIPCSIRSASKCDPELATRITHAILTLAMPRSSLNNACPCSCLYNMAKCRIRSRAGADGKDCQAR